MKPKNFSTITAILLVGGFGTRLRTVIAEKPKCLAPIKGKPLIYYLLKKLQSEGVRKTVLCTGYLAEQVEAEIGAEFPGMSLIYSQENEPLGTGGALRLALPKITSDTVLVLNGDSYCEAEYSQFLGEFQRKNANASILLTKVQDSGRFGKVKTAEDGSIIAFSEKTIDDSPGWVNAGIYLMKKKMIVSIPDNGSISLERQIFPDWIGRKFFGYKSEGRFLDIGTPASYAEADRFFCNFPI